MSYSQRVNNILLTRVGGRGEDFIFIYLFFNIFFYLNLWQMVLEEKNPPECEEYHQTLVVWRRAWKTALEFCFLDTDCWLKVSTSLTCQHRVSTKTELAKWVTFTQRGWHRMCHTCQHCNRRIDTILKVKSYSACIYFLWMVPHQLYIFCLSF